MVRLQPRNRIRETDILGRNRTAGATPTDVATETEQRTAADSALTARVALEEQNRGGGDNVLRIRIAAEETARSAALLTEAAARLAGDTEEAAARTAAIVALAAVYQAINANLTAISLLTTTGFGRGLLELADQAALLAEAGAAAAAHNHAQSDITNLTTDLAAKVDEGGTLVDAASVEALTFSAVATQAECEALRDAVAALLETLRVHD